MPLSAKYNLSATPRSSMCRLSFSVRFSSELTGTAETLSRTCAFAFAIASSPAMIRYSSCDTSVSLSQKPSTIAFGLPPGLSGSPSFITPDGHQRNLIVHVFLSGPVNCTSLSAPGSGSAIAATIVVHVPGPQASNRSKRHASSRRIRRRERNSGWLVTSDVISSYFPAR